MTEIIDGKELAKTLDNEMIRQVGQLKQRGVVPGLAVIMVGNDAASQIYVRNKHRRSQKIGIQSRDITFPWDISETELLAQIDDLNHDPDIDGILVQLPLPKHIHAKAVLEHISPEKDVDGFHPINVGRLWNNDGKIVPSTPYGIMTMLDRYHVQIAGKNALIIGRSTIVGRPMAAMLLNANATVTIAHSQTDNLKTLVHAADILIVAVGISHFIRGEDIKPGAIVIDVGMNRDSNNHLTGDVDFDSAKTVASMITPVPGGVGPMTITMLMQQTINIASRRTK
ncbi:bifunctional methylenetetrahydrofolate dehydrogenase/methenyltetrahydrofolate cyclohydrolase FolD [Agrilactobacillus fermenti]|uniref:bifunctional methylenetetrahydrofolate dehydrogenase/methenyltetrahydrofolate cyclohydrolase FolD n=1 Tax=Agrilactobacillus fermenti TaxID=2586909 RepID=UPI001E607448|nr:bifunctional methylenetetrahydrofolate dehydrogenase/methenyltetrahydrofolate cyclohydrolase FolD [Agrilactobacillus fermenti]MCD2256207.1 bifunctional methylenetetrahydrofolate dehydrogenase/methenyltetrahydrofolate cyclohydrolase FolD [Agrilactobacillus fermenti]